MMDVKENGLHLQEVQKNPIKKASILFSVHNSLPYDHAGYALRTHSLARHLLNCNVPVLVATRAGYPWDFKKFRKIKHREENNTIDNVHYVRLKDEAKTFKNVSDLIYIDTYTNELIKTAKEHHATILHAHSNYFNGLAAIKASKQLKVPSIYEIRGLWYITRLTLDANYKYGGMFDYEQTMEKDAALAADAVVTISKALKMFIISWGIDPAKIHVIPNAVDTTFFKPSLKSLKLVDKYKLKNKIVIGFIGSITGYEGLEQLIQSVNQLINEGLNLSLIIVGEGREKYKLERLANSRDIIFTGRVPFEDVKEYYSLFDICPFPRNDFEVCQYVPPLKILEAMAMQKAIIVSDVAPLLEIIENNVNGLVCKANDINSLKTVIKKLYADKKLRESLAHNAHNWVVKNRSWDSVIHKYMKLYNSFKEK